jgi:hypothetical protein
MNSQSWLLNCVSFLNATVSRTRQRCEFWLIVVVAVTTSVPRYTRRSSARRLGAKVTRYVALQPKTGMLILGVLHERIVQIEVLYRDEIRRRLLSVIPKPCDDIQTT